MLNKVKFILTDLLLDSYVASGIVIINKLETFLSSLYYRQEKCYHSRYYFEIKEKNSLPQKIFNQLKEDPSSFFTIEDVNIRKVNGLEDKLRLGDELLVSLDDNFKQQISLRVLNISDTSFSLITLPAKASPGVINFKLELNNSQWKFSIDVIFLFDSESTVQKDTLWAMNKFENSSLWVNCCEQFAKKYQAIESSFTPITITSEKFNLKSQKWERIFKENLTVI